MKVSVVVPLYNKERWIRRALESIAAQDFSDFEVLVVDDGSTDGGSRVVSKYPDSRFQLIRQANAGPGAARNRGIAQAKGEFIAFLDADDEWLPNHLQDSVLILDRLEPEIASVTSGYFEYPRGISREPMWRHRGIQEGPFRLCASTTPLGAVYRLAYMSPWSTVVRAGICQKWGGFYERDRCLYAEDSYLWLKILLNETVAFHMAPTVRYHTEASELSNNLNNARPIEPFLLDPPEIEASCPAHLRALLSNILAVRAFKTACQLGYWGRWREARLLRKRFSVAGDWKLPYYIPGMICSTPLGASLGQLARILKHDWIR